MDNYGWLSPDGEFIRVDKSNSNHDNSAREICRKIFKINLDAADQPVDFLLSKGWTRVTHSGSEIFLSVNNYKKAKSAIEIFVDKNFKKRKIHVYDYIGRSIFVGEGEDYLEDLSFRSGKGEITENLLLKNIMKTLQQKIIEAQLHGLALKNQKDENDFDPEELQKGIAVEMEHTEDEDVAKTIALDHLTENPTYYTDLENSGIE